MTSVLNGTVKPGDLIAYSVRRYWDMATRIGVVVSVYDDMRPHEILVRVVKSSDEHQLTRMVWLTELDRVVKVKGIS